MNAFQSESQGDPAREGAVVATRPLSNPRPEADRKRNCEGRAATTCAG